MKTHVVAAAAALVLLFLTCPLNGQAPVATDAQTKSARPFIPPPPKVVPEPVLEAPPAWDVILPEKMRSPSVSDQTLTLLGRSPDALPAPPAATLLRAIIGFVALLALAYLGGSRPVSAIERQFNIGHLITTGLPFVIAGLVASHPDVGILTRPMLREIGPLLPLGLGWIGFVIGSRFDGVMLNRLPSSIAASVFILAAVPVASIVVVMAGTLAIAQLAAFTPSAIRDSILLATAGAMAARNSPYLLKAFFPGQIVPERLVRMVELEQLVGVFGILMVSVSYRPPDALVGWQLPPAAWIFITLGIGATMGIVVYSTLTHINKDPHFTAALLGCVAFTAGMASYLRLSPLAVCFMAGAIVINLGGPWKQQVRDVFHRLERPIYFLFMIIAGALWHPWEWQGWLLMTTFISARLLSKWLSAKLLRHTYVRDLSTGEQRALTLAPMGALSVAIVVSAQDLYSGPTVDWIVTAVVGGSVVTEAVLQAAFRKAAERRPAMETPGVVVQPAPHPVSAEVD